MRFSCQKIVPLLTVKTMRPRYYPVSNPQKADPPTVQLAQKISSIRKQESVG